MINKDEEQWWTARNSMNQMGSIPVPYVQKVGVEGGGQVVALIFYAGGPVNELGRVHANLASCPVPTYRILRTGSIMVDNALSHAVFDQNVSERVPRWGQVGVCFRQVEVRWWPCCTTVLLDMAKWQQDTGGTCQNTAKWLPARDRWRCDVATWGVQYSCCFHLT